MFPGNYHEYESDEMAVQRTKEIVRDLKDKFCSWEDPSFPHGKHKLSYFIASDTFASVAVSI